MKLCSSLAKFQCSAQAKPRKSRYWALLVRQLDMNDHHSCDQFKTLWLASWSLPRMLTNVSQTLQIHAWGCLPEFGPTIMWNNTCDASRNRSLIPRSAEKTACGRCVAISDGRTLLAKHQFEQLESSILLDLLQLKQAAMKDRSRVPSFACSDFREVLIVGHFDPQTRCTWFPRRFQQQLAHGSSSKDAFPLPSSYCIFQVMANHSPDDHAHVCVKNAYPMLFH